MEKSGRILRIAAIILMALTAAMNVLGGAGTSCAAFSNNVGYRMAFKDLMDYRWLYQGLVITTVLIGLVGIWATVKLVRGGPTVYRNALIILAIGTVLGGIQYFASMTLRGKAAPANVKFYINILTLVVFLLFKIPAIWEKVDFSNPSSKAENAAASGVAAILTGIVTLTIFGWAGPTHTFFGENWVYVFYTPLIISGSFLVAGGAITLLWAAKEIVRQETASQQLQLSEQMNS